MTSQTSAPTMLCSGHRRSQFLGGRRLFAFHVIRTTGMAFWSALWAAARAHRNREFAQVTVHVLPRSRSEGGGGAPKFTDIGDKEH